MSANRPKNIDAQHAQPASPPSKESVCRDRDLRPRSRKHFGTSDPEQGSYGSKVTALVRHGLTSTSDHFGGWSQADHGRDVRLPETHHVARRSKSDCFGPVTKVKIQIGN
jgi:hypothetical protein